MARRRFGPLVVSVLAVTLLLLLRLAQVQTGPQHEVWADEATSLMRFGRVVPYRRGELIDRQGRVLLRDTDAYRVVLVYREFRREHPLGQVAHALSAIELRCVPLGEAWERMDELALALVELSPAQVEGFGRGAELALGPLQAAAVAKSDGEQRAREDRWSRRGDVSFYVTRLLDLEGREAGRLARLLREQERLRDEPFVELAARVRRADRAASPDEIRAELAARLAACRTDLDHLAQLLLLAEPESARRAGQGARARLLERLEGWRAVVEDGAASDLFEDACGFEPGRVEPAALLDTVDLVWMGALMRWEPARVAVWLGRERAAWLGAQGLGPDPESDYALHQLGLEVELAPVSRDRAQLVLERWMEPFLAPEAALRKGSLRAWLTGQRIPEARPLAVFVELDDLFELRVPVDERPSGTLLFPFQELADLERGAQDASEVLARAECWWPEAVEPQLEALRKQALVADAARRTRRDGTPRPPLEQALEKTDVVERTAYWRALREQHARGEVRAMRSEVLRHTRAQWELWERLFQDRLALALSSLAQHAKGKLQLAEGRLDRSGDRARFVLRDHGGRSAVAAEAPDYELVHLLSRRPASFAGFEVQPSHERQRERFVPPGGGSRRAPLVDDLLGKVLTPQPRDLYERREQREAFARLSRLGARSDEEQAELEQLATWVLRPDEVRGSGGLEGYLHPELSGTNGYREEFGLQEEVERGGRPTNVAPVDGLPVELTLDLDLQLAALEVLQDPRPDPRGEKLDPGWLARPAGAIVLLDVVGDVLAMASFPDEVRGDGLETRDMPLERTLRLYDSQPPGSLMKPFVAVWALDKLGLGPGMAIECSRATHHDGLAGYKTVHCNLADGHGTGVELHEALRRSCNSYFAWVGDTRFSPASWLEMYAAFGFGQRTGVRSLGQRSGLSEDGWRASTQPGVEALRAQRTLMLACNGLGQPQTTVLQVARAYAGLATGTLPEARLVRAVGGQPLEPRARQLPLRSESLARVRAALRACANDTGWPAGSAAPALNARELGFVMAAKTGSADLERADIDGESRVLKHTWLAGWFPADRPRYVLVVFCYRTYATSSHSSIWIAQQYLQHPTVREWLRRNEVLP